MGTTQKDILYLLLAKQKQASFRRCLKLLAWLA